MMSISSQLLQPLFVDINITYDLDMSKFPGLDDPEHMYQPALLIESPESRVTWMSVLSQHDGVDTRVASVDDDNSSVTYSGHSQSIEEDLYTLIDSCNLSPPCAVTGSPPNDGVDASPSDGGLDLLEGVYDSLSTDVNICQRTRCFHSEYLLDNYYPGNLCRREPWPVTEPYCDNAAECFREQCSTKSCCVDAAEWFREQCLTESRCGDAVEWFREQCSTESSSNDAAKWFWEQCSTESSCGDAVEWFREQCSTESSCDDAAEWFRKQCCTKSSCSDATVWFREQCSTEDITQSCSMKPSRLHYLRLDDEVGNPRIPMDLCRTQSRREA